MQGTLVHPWSGKILHAKGPLSPWLQLLKRAAHLEPVSESKEVARGLSTAVRSGRMAAARESP